MVKPRVQSKKRKAPSGKLKVKSQNAKNKPKRQVPHFGKASETLVRTFENALQDFPMAQPRKMMGFPSATINGNMFAGLFNDKMILRLSEQDAATMPGAKPFEPMPGRAMRGWIVVPASTLNSPRELNAWMDKAFVHARTLPKKILGHGH